MYTYIADSHRNKAEKVEEGAGGRGGGWGGGGGVGGLLLYGYLLFFVSLSKKTNLSLT